MKALMQLLAVAAALLVPGASHAQKAEGYPTRPVRVIVGFTAGGPTDVIARLVAQKLSESLGQQFYVENVPGAGGNLAAAQTARAAPTATRFTSSARASSSTRASTRGTSATIR